MGKKPLYRSYRSRKSDLIINIEDAPFQYQEAINSLRTNLRFVSMTGKCNKIAITSSIPGEGKTSIAINLSFSLASSGSSVLLIDCDLRKPLLHRYLKLPGGTSVGLTNIIGSTSIDKGLFHNTAHNFYVLTSGTKPPNPTTILASPGMGDLLDKVSKMFDYVILDTAPVAMVADAAALSQYTDGVIMMVRQKMVTFDQARQAKKNLTKVNANILGVVLNDFDTRRINKDSGYYYSGYYNYYGYGEEDEPSVEKIT